ncbi:hypothetical protein GCM10011351_11070 [Paraliobacillus quinghaiensis]|uniref:Uncharacterized protein n=1 Tax=Paraliobacillus quinghaiensis TaxID=470815 RepID=A0A917WTN6_9BACI|nr:hypothetical protein [Paraliobacillus quinghaiensis]GGM27079.1 hypothetical protein GCM10011351_11070 [Paraliobacillus quinghaiensis]
MLTTKEQLAAKPKGMTAEKALTLIKRQMTLNGYRDRTLADYDRHFYHFIEVTGIKYLEQITVDTIYVWRQYESITFN